MMAMISFRSLELGTSTKNMPSNRPARRNSGGSSPMLLAVAITRIGLVVSCSQTKKCAIMPEVVPPSVLPDDFTPANTFSTSSSHTTPLPKASIVAVACLIFRSLSPTSEPLSAEMSSRIKGQLKIEAAALQDNDLPVPGMPTKSSAFGLGRCELSGSNALLRLARYCLNRSKPPTWSAGTGGQNSIKPLLRIICIFCAVITFSQNRFSRTRLSAKAVSLSNPVSPRAASMASSATSTPTLSPSSCWIWRNSSRVGSLKSSMVMNVSTSWGS